MTPFGPVCIVSDGQRVDLQPEPHRFDGPMTREKPLDGCCRIRVKGGRTVRCFLENSGTRGMDSSGEGYQAVEFTDGCRNLTIGTEADRPDLEVRPGPGGIEVTVLGDAMEVVFGIAWTLRYEGASDVRTWFAADPTLD